MRDRAAIDTIKGYFYQFDYSIDQIINLPNDKDKVVVEGIEDIDIRSATVDCAVQCKYYAKSEYNHSLIAEPVRQMLNHYADVKKNGKSRIRYKLRGHYKAGQNKLLLPLTVKALKDQFLIYVKNKKVNQHHADLGLRDEDLKEFISLLEIDIHAKDFNCQFQDLINAFIDTFKCSKFSAEYFYYNNALRVIKELAIQPCQLDRTISKREFLNQINTTKILFNEWFVNLKGEKQHFQELKKEYFTALNISPFERFFLLEVDPITYSRNDIKELLFLISRKWSKLTTRDPRPFCPYVYIHGIDASELIELKKELMRERFLFWDGFDYAGADFNPNSITRKADCYNQIKIKLINCLPFIDMILREISTTREIYQFYLQNCYFNCADPAIKHIRIQVDKLINIKHII